MARSFYQNAQKPEGTLGRMMMQRMNQGHARMAAWGFEHMDLKDDFDVIDVGCGGGANLAVLLQKCSKGTVTGVDYADVSVELSTENNKKAIEEGRCKVLKADVLDLPFEEDTFDHATAFETVFFWPDIEKSFGEVRRILKPGAKFVICNEMSSETSDEEWQERIEGLRLYTHDEMLAHLEAAGFRNVEVFTEDEEGWVVFVSEK